MVRYCSKNYKNRESKIVATLLLFSFLAILFLFNPQNIVAKGEGNQRAYVVIEASSNRILKASTEHTSMPMASTTKIMTAILTIEIADLKDIITIPKKAVGIEGSSIYLKEGQKISVKDLLYGLMLRSGNDAAVALALHVAGTVEKFVILMNEKVKELGLKHTKFQNPHGLSQKNHYTSAYDLAIITSYAFKNEIFRDIVSTKMHVVKGENEEENQYFANKNRILYNYSGANGVKTGYTMEAGRCLVASSERDGMQVIAVALNYYNYFELCSELMDYAHKNYYLAKIADSSKPYAEVKVKKGKGVKETKLFVQEDRYYPLKKDGSEEIITEINATSEIIAPHEKTNSCGDVKFYVGNNLIFQEKLYTIYNIEKKWISIF